jgi:hypothetical protein
MMSSIAPPSLFISNLLVPEGDAVRPDGTLKDASEMTWSYDPDESIPFPLGSTSVNSSTSSAMAALAMTVAGVHRTTRVIRPCQCYCKDGAAEASSTHCEQLGAKRKASSNDLQCCVACKVTIVVDKDPASEGETSTGEDFTGEDEEAASNVDVDRSSDSGTTTEPGSDDFESLQAMADANNEVCSPSLFLITTFLFISQAVMFRSQNEHTADVRLLFRRDREYVHPDTGKILDGHWCLLCQ